MSADKYPSIFSRQMETIVYLARDSEPIRLLKTPRSLSVYILNKIVGFGAAIFQFRVSVKRIRLLALVDYSLGENLWSNC